jgi:hypothetical protein
VLKLGSMLRLCSGAVEGDEDGEGEAVGDGDGEGIGDGEGEGVGDGVGSTEKNVREEWVTVAWGESGSNGST